MANVNAYYKLNVPISIGSLTVGNVNEVRSFDEWTAIVCPGRPDELARLIDTYTTGNGHPTTWFTLDSAPPVGSDGLVLADALDTTPATLFGSLFAGTNITFSVVVDSGKRKVRIDSSGGSGSGTVIAEFRNTAGSFVIPSDLSPFDVPYPTMVQASSAVTKLGGDDEFRINTSGAYIVIATYLVESGDAMMGKKIWLEVDSGSGFAVATNLFSSSNESAFPSDQQNTWLIAPIIVNATDVVKVVGLTSGGTTDGVLSAEGCSLYILRFDPASGTDPDALHVDVPGELATVTEDFPEEGDFGIYEKTGSGSAKRKFNFSRLERITTATVATTNATVTTVATIAIPATTTLLIDGTVVARRTGGGSGTAEDGAAYHVMAAYKNVAGTATLIGAGSITVIGEDQAGWDVTLSASGGNALVRVTGAASNNVNWEFTYTTKQVS